MVELIIEILKSNGFVDTAYPNGVVFIFTEEDLQSAAKEIIKVIK